jgi:ABC-2 type transport system ATP-binding protein
LARSTVDSQPVDPIISIHRLTRRFGSRAAVAGLDLTVLPGEIYGLVGPDGAGKTTTFRLLAGALRPDSGGGTIAGYDLIRGIETVRAQIGYLPQRFSLYGDLTVAENLRFFAEVHAIPAAEWRARRERLLAFTGLQDFTGRLAAQLSGGMKQKLGLATALIHRPRLLLLDEPTAGVDPVTRQDFWQLIGRAVAEEGLTVLVSTPYMDEAARCSHVAFLSHGRLLLEGAPRDLTGRLDGRIVELVGQPYATLRQVAAADPGVEELHRFGPRLHLRLLPHAAPAVLARLPAALARAGVFVERLQPIPATLEDVFIHLLEQSESAAEVP